MTTANIPHQYQLTFVMPALNEEGNLPGSVANVLEGFARCQVAGELIIVNDGSSDRTGELAEQFSADHGNVSVIHHDKCRGIGGSFWAGVQRAKGEIVVMIPGDGENDAGEILRYLPLLEEVDLVVPFVSNPWVRSWRRRLLSRLYQRIITTTFRLPLNYLNGTVMYRRSALEGIILKNNGFFYQAELLIKTIRSGCRFTEVPYLLKKRSDGVSKATNLGALSKVIQGYLATFAEIYLVKTGD
ncbi:MAG: glycosyltransferase family 2 protein [Verrucomicrobia bacterium]|nr:glycosyltransferase family 2 protein [Deltaproteobacteria bacterium]